MLLLYGDPANYPAEDSPDFGAVMAEYTTFGEAAAAAGVMGPSEALMPPTMATTIRVRDGKTLSTDGPFAEAREQLGGFYILECANLDDAIAWAAKVPDARHGSVEIRPIWEIPQN